MKMKMMATNATQVTCNSQVGVIAQQLATHKAKSGRPKRRAHLRLVSLGVALAVLLAGSLGALASHLGKPLSSNFLSHNQYTSGSANSNSNSQNQHNQSELIIQLDSHNFNLELIQFKSPFGHVKLVEFYIPFSRFCTKFKPTLARLARYIAPWRNVIRLASIDLGASNNSPIASSWSVQTVPTLRLHPATSPAGSEAKHLYEHYVASNSSIQNFLELQKSAFAEYNATLGAKVKPLDAGQYLDKPGLLKRDLLDYIDKLVASQTTASSGQLPASWPELRPVALESLRELVRSHPRNELFLLVEGPIAQLAKAATGSGNPSPKVIDGSMSALELMLRLSSSTAYKSVRRVATADNPKFVQGLVGELRLQAKAQRHPTATNEVRETNAGPLPNLVDLLNDFEDLEQVEWAQDNLVLIHVEIQRQIDNPSPSYQLNVVTQKYLEAAKKLDATYVSPRAKRSFLFGDEPSAASASQELESSHNAKLELFATYVQHVYVDTQEDRKFVRSLELFDEQLRAANRLRHQPVRGAGAPPRLMAEPNGELDTASDTSGSSEKGSSLSLNPIKFIVNLFHADATPSAVQFQMTSTSNNIGIANNNNLKEDDPQAQQQQNAVHQMRSSNSKYLVEYADEIKAIGKMFEEAGRLRAINAEQVQTLVDLCHVLKTYFPFADSASMQFVEGVARHLESWLAMAATDPSVVAMNTSEFKAEMQRLKAEGKQVSEVAQWRKCDPNSSYQCGLWRLFHTLTAFEYKKLSQLNDKEPQARSASQALASSPSLEQQQQQNPQRNVWTSVSNNSSQDASNKLPVAEETITVTPTSGDRLDVPTAAAASSPSPVERLVSSPVFSTTSSLSLTIAPSSSSSSPSSGSNWGYSSSSVGQLLDSNGRSLTETNLPRPVLLVMRDFITKLHGCHDCAVNFQNETQELNQTSIRSSSAEFSVIKLWEIHNKVTKRLEQQDQPIEPEPIAEATSKATIRGWFPSYAQCNKCYATRPSYIDANGELAENADSRLIFQESIQWNLKEVLDWLLREYIRLEDPSDVYIGLDVATSRAILIFGLVGLSMLAMAIVMLGCQERRRRHKLNLLNMNSNGQPRYSLELQPKTKSGWRR